MLFLLVVHCNSASTLDSLEVVGIPTDEGAREEKAWRVVTGPLPPGDCSVALSAIPKGEVRHYISEAEYADGIFEMKKCIFG